MARLAAAMEAARLTPAQLASRAKVTEATVSNWLTGKVGADNAKAAVLLRVSQVLEVRPEWLLFGDGQAAAAEARQSHPLKLDVLTIAFQLVYEALDQKGLQLPPPKRAELTALVFELLEEGMPEAKVLRFARAAAA